MSNKTALLAAPRRREALAMYEASVLAVERRREVFEAVDASADPEDAIRRVQRLLSVSEVHARAVLDAQLRRFTVRDRARILEERDRLRAVVTSPPGE